VCVCVSFADVGVLVVCHDGIYRCSPNKYVILELYDDDDDLLSLARLLLFCFDITAAAAAVTITIAKYIFIDSNGIFIYFLAGTR
jgi:hypothetical protein